MNTDVVQAKVLKVERQTRTTTQIQYILPTLDLKFHSGYTFKNFFIMSSLFLLAFAFLSFFSMNQSIFGFHVTILYFSTSVISFEFGEEAMELLNCVSGALLRKIGIK